MTFAILICNGQSNVFVHYLQTIYIVYTYNHIIGVIEFMTLGLRDTHFITRPFIKDKVNSF